MGQPSIEVICLTAPQPSIPSAKRPANSLPAILLHYRDHGYRVWPPGRNSFDIFFQRERPILAQVRPPTA